MSDVTENIYEAPIPRIFVIDNDEQEHRFSATGLHEDYTFTYNEYTGELTVERVAYGPRGTDEWARTSAVVVAAWPADGWISVTTFNSQAIR